jgi:hypothetical protein
MAKLFSSDLFGSGPERRREERRARPGPTAPKRPPRAMFPGGPGSRTPAMPTPRVPGAVGRRPRRDRELPPEISDDRDWRFSPDDNNPPPPPGGGPDGRWHGGDWRSGGAPGWERYQTGLSEDRPIGPTPRPPGWERYQTGLSEDRDPRFRFSPQQVVAQQGQQVLANGLLRSGVSRDRLSYVMDLINRFGGAR